jgi:hypothetical protein
MRRCVMDKQLEMFDAWMQSQKEFMETLTKAQMGFWESMNDSAKKMQETFLCAAIPHSQQEPGAAEALGLINKMTEGMVASSKNYIDEVMRMQEALRHTIDKQMEMGRRAATNVFEAGMHAKEKGNKEEAA